MEICQNESSIYPLHFPGKIRILFTLFGLFLAGNKAVSQFKRSQSKFDITYLTHTIPGQLPVKIFGSNTSSFAAIGRKGHFRKILTQIFKSGCFSWYHACIFEMNELYSLMHNLMLNELAPISNPNKEKPKSSYAFF